MPFHAPPYYPPVHDIPLELTWVFISFLMQAHYRFAHKLLGGVLLLESNNFLDRLPDPTRFKLPAHNSLLRPLHVVGTSSRLLLLPNATSLLLTRLEPSIRWVFSWLCHGTLLPLRAISYLAKTSRANLETNNLVLACISARWPLRYLYRELRRVSMLKKFPGR